MATPYRFSPFATQHISPAADRNAPGRPAPVPAGRNQASSQEERAPSTWQSIPQGSAKSGNRDRNFGTEHLASSAAEMGHAQASLQGQVGRHLSGVPSGWMGDASAVQPADLLHLASRLTQGARDAGVVARNTEILAARLSAALPEGHAYKGVAYAVNQHAEHAQLLADAHAVVVRLAAYPEIMEVLSALENGAEVVVRTAESHASSPSRAAGFRSCKTGAVGGEHNPTLNLPGRWSGLIEKIAGHRKSSSPAHHVCPSVREQNSTDEVACASKDSGYLSQGRRA